MQKWSKIKIIIISLTFSGARKDNHWKNIFWNWDNSSEQKKIWRLNDRQTQFLGAQGKPREIEKSDIKLITFFN